MHGHAVWQSTGPRLRALDKRVEQRPAQTNARRQSKGLCRRALAMAPQPEQRDSGLRSEGSVQSVERLPDLGVTVVEGDELSDRTGMLQRFCNHLRHVGS